jgi:hypothetical protein
VETKKKKKGVAKNDRQVVSRMQSFSYAPGKLGGV